MCSLSCYDVLLECVCVHAFARVCVYACAYVRVRVCVYIMTALFPTAGLFDMDASVRSGLVKGLLKNETDLRLNRDSPFMCRPLSSTPRFHPPLLSSSYGRFTARAFYMENK